MNSFKKALRKINRNIHWTNRTFNSHFHFEHTYHIELKTVEWKWFESQKSMKLLCEFRVEKYDENGKEGGHVDFWRPAQFIFENKLYLSRFIYGIATAHGMEFEKC